jgi:hypothetical protein
MGLHELRVEFFADAGVAALILGWSGPGIPRQVIPARQFSHSAEDAGA